MSAPTIPFGLPLSLLRLRRLGARKEMIGVDKIDDIRKLGRGGASVASISRDAGVSEPTVRKRLRGAGPLREAPRRREGAGVAPARAVCGAGGLVAARGQALLVQAAPHREEGVRRADGEGLRRLLHHGPAVREEEKGGARGRVCFVKRI